MQCVPGLLGLCDDPVCRLAAHFLQECRISCPFRHVAHELSDQVIRIGNQCIASSKLVEQLPVLYPVRNVGQADGGYWLPYKTVTESPDEW